MLHALRITSVDRRRLPAPDTPAWHLRGRRRCSLEQTVRGFAHSVRSQLLISRTYLIFSSTTSLQRMPQRAPARARTADEERAASRTACRRPNDCDPLVVAQVLVEAGSEAL